MKRELPINQENITWRQVQNFWPIVTLLVGVIVSFWSIYAQLSTKLEVLISRVDNLIQVTNQNSETSQKLMGRISDQETRITRIETRLDIRN